MKKNELKFKKAFTPTPVFAKKKLVWGFTLIETLVAITILSAAVAGPMVLSIKNIGTASVSQDQLVAFYLGQEVIEYVRNVRDTNILKESVDWLDGLDVCKTNGCYIDVLNETDPITDCGTSGCVNRLKFDKDTGKYNYTSDEETIFTRTVKIENPVGTNSDEAKISVSIKWTGKYGEKIMNLQDNIFNWR
ncbi:MAG: hypothetical protein UW04_C0057G0008 [Parcubacteria group bacterium GW2011_GWB1_43_8]|nr:MAG: hypothetical protein UW04_C0057G0008 [Parcubacteria group bacterium GW2011_GWB1_43_8]